MGGWRSRFRPGPCEPSDFIPRANGNRRACFQAGERVLPASSLRKLSLAALWRKPGRERLKAKRQESVADMRARAADVLNSSPGTRGGGGANLRDGERREDRRDLVPDGLRGGEGEGGIGQGGLAFRPARRTGLLRQRDWQGRMKREPSSGPWEAANTGSGRRQWNRCQEQG